MPITQLVTDTFTGTTGALISARSPDLGPAPVRIGGTANAAISAEGRARVDASGNATYNYNAGNPNVVSADFVSMAAVANSLTPALTLRDNGSNSRYFLTCSNRQFNLLVFKAGVQSSPTAIFIPTMPFSAVRNVKMTIQDGSGQSTVRCYVAGELFCEFVDTTPLLTGVAGLKVQANSTTEGIHLDNFSALLDTDVGPVNPSIYTLDNAAIDYNPAALRYESGALRTSDGGNYFQVVVAGPRVKLRFDTTINRANGVAMPSISWRVGAGAWTKQSLANNSSNLAEIDLGANLDPAPRLLTVMNNSIGNNSYTPQVQFAAKEIELINGYSLASPTRQNYSLVMGNSIVNAASAAGHEFAFPFLLGGLLTTTMGVVGHPGQGWNTQYLTSPTFPGTYLNYDSTHARVWSGLKRVIISMGTNDAPATNITSYVAALIPELRSKVGSNCFIYFAQPFRTGYAHAAEFQAAIDTYKSTTGDLRVSRLTSLSDNSAALMATTVDQIHPNDTGHSMMATYLNTEIQTFEAAIEHMLRIRTLRSGGQLTGLIKTGGNL